MITSIALHKKASFPKLILLALLFSCLQSLKAQQSPGGVGSSFQLWLKAETGVTNSSGVSEWIDQSPNALTGQQPNVNNRPGFIANDINFHPSIDFQGEPTGTADPNFDYINFGLESLGLTNKIVVYYVGNIDQQSPDHYVIGQKDGFERWRYANGYMQVKKGADSFYDILDNFTQELNRNYVHGYILDDTSGFHKKDGFSLPSESLTSGNWLTNEETWVGATESSGIFSYDGQISEIIVYNNVLSPVEQQLVESYLALKYGITLDQTVPTDYLSSTGAVIWDATANNGYKTDIFGIGVDVTSSLNQKVSRSVNGNGPILATTPHFTEPNNDPLRTTSLGNGNFMVMAHDNAANTFTASYNGGSDNRLGRVWKVDETGTVGDVHFAVPYAAYTFPSGGTPSVVISNDTTFDGSDTVLPLVYDRTTGMYSAQINPADGDYITLAISEISVAIPSYYRGSSDGNARTTTDGVTRYTSYTDFINGTNGVYTSYSQNWAFEDDFFADGIYFYKTNSLIDKIFRYPSFEDLLASTVGNNGTEFVLSQTRAVTDQFFASGNQFFKTNSSSTGTNSLTAYPSFEDLVADTNGVIHNFSTEYAFEEQFFHDGQFFCKTTVTGGTSTGVDRYRSLSDLVDGTVFDSQSFAFGPYNTNDDIFAVGITAGFTLGATALTIDEDGGTGTFTVVLNAQPVDDVVLDITSGDTGEATVSTAQLTFTPANWDTPQTVTVTGVDDNTLADDSATVTVAINDVGSHDAFDALDDRTVAITLTDDDSAGFTLGATALTIDEDGGTGIFTVVLNAEPVNDVVLDITSGDTGEATVGTAQLTFTAANWDTPQTVTVTGVADNVTTDDSATITLAINDAGSDDTFDALADQTVAITLTNDDADFTIDAIADANVNENTAYTGVTPNVSGDTPFGNVTYTLGGSDAANFTIDSATGTVSMIARDFESPVDDDLDNVYELTVTATDENGNTDSEEWTVTVDDVIETASFTIDAIADANVNENTAYTGVTPSLSGDAPIGPVSYTLADVDADDFTIDPTTGVVSMIAKDFENPTDSNTNNIYLASILATDADGNTASVSWDVTVADVIETASFTIDAIADVDVDENTAYTGVTPSLSGDAPIGTVTYTLADVDANDFTIDSATGVVSMIAKDFENPTDSNTNNIYLASIVATDADGNTASVSWDVTVADVIETASFTINVIPDETIDEETPYTGPVPSITGAPIGNLTYTVGGADAAIFTINATTGQVIMPLRSFENPDDVNGDNVYEVSITATDDDGNRDSEDWTITLRDIVEPASFTIAAISDVNVDENSAYTGEIPTVSGMPVGNLTYSITGTDAAAFTVNAGTGEVGLPARDFESPNDANGDNRYEITLTATDEDGNSASENWTVSVQNVTEIASFTIAAIADADVDENTAYTGVTPSLSGDAPIGQVTYSLGGSDAASYTIDAATGVVSMVARDFENPFDDNGDNGYELSITAIDGDGNSATEDWTVTVRNVIENDVDSDGDGVPDDVETSGTPASDPNDPSSFTDTDGDGVPDYVEINGTPASDPNDPNSFTDTDGDGAPDYIEINGTPASDPNDPSSFTDADGDGLPDYSDPDDGNPDSDGDGIPDGEDADIDGDGTIDNGADSDGDGINDANDTVDNSADTDGDGVPDVDDAFPNDPDESVDLDGDGIGANADNDDSDPNIGEEAHLVAAEAFTPNGDGINDTWIVQGIENYPNSMVTVYNRYGHEVFKAVGYKNDWSGRYSSRSEILPAGSYYYVIDFQDGSNPKDGWIFINY